MLPQSKGKIFLTQERGHNEMEWYRSYNTFNFGNYQNEHKIPFGALYVLNDDTLAGGKRISMQVDEDSDIVLIPIVGAIEYRDSYGNSGILEAGQSQILDIRKGGFFEIENPYETELVNFLQLWIKTPGKTSAIAPCLCSFDLGNNKNKLIELFAPDNKISAPKAIGFIGQFDGRQEAVYELSNSDNALFAFVIDGEFEVQYRLLHPRDGLVLWDVKELELEALSNNAVIVIIEVPLI